MSSGTRVLVRPNGFHLGKPSNSILTTCSLKWVVDYAENRWPSCAMLCLPTARSNTHLKPTQASTGHDPSHQSFSLTHPRFIKIYTVSLQKPNAETSNHVWLEHHYRDGGRLAKPFMKPVFAVLVISSSPTQCHAQGPSTELLTDSFCLGRCCDLVWVARYPSCQLPHE